MDSAEFDLNFLQSPLITSPKLHQISSKVKIEKISNFPQNEFNLNTHEAQGIIITLFSAS